MRHLINMPFKSREPFIFGDGAPASDHQATVCEIMLRTLELYRPYPSRTLGISGLRSWKHILSRLQEPYAAYGFDEGEWATLLTVMEWTLPRVPWFRHAPDIMDLLAEVREE